MLVRSLRRDWRRHLVVVTSDTVVRWHRAGWRLYWRWRSRSPGGRPRLTPEVQALMARMSRENQLWGSERIRGELLHRRYVVIDLVFDTREQAEAFLGFLKRQVWGVPANAPALAGTPQTMILEPAPPS